MIYVGKHYDAKSNRTWVDRKCSLCGSSNITPTGKCQNGDRSMCYYLCEECGYQPEELFTYAYDGRLREVVPDSNFTLHTYY